LPRYQQLALVQILLAPLHDGQRRAYQALRMHRFMALRSGRRFGKTALAQTLAAQIAIQGGEVGWFAPEHKHMAEVYADLKITLAPLLDSSSKSPASIRLATGGHIDWWSMGNPLSARGRRYQLVVIDEAAFAKDGDNRSDDSAAAMWEKVILPTLYDYAGKALVCSNSAGKNPDNFFYRLCTDPSYGFFEYHATTMDNPLLPKRIEGERSEAWSLRRGQYLEDLRRDNDPLVYAQEYLADFVDWSGAAFFSRGKLLSDGEPVPLPSRCDGVFAVIDTASKTGTDHDATGVTYFAYEKTPAPRLYILDWDVVQIEGALLELWLPSVFSRAEDLSRRCGARGGSIGAFIEDKNSGTILLQQARRRELQAHPIESKLTSLGKDERALSVSGYVHRGLVKYTASAFDKVTVYKQKSGNHLVDQIESFRLGDKKSDREDDLLDTFCYGIAIALGDGDGF
jgi:hypothetical protein